MDANQALTYLRALITSVTIGVIVPGLMLLSMVCLFLWVLRKAQERDDFDVSEFLRGDDGKLSSVKLFAFISCCVHTWVIAVETMASRISDNQMLIYSVTWSGSLVLAAFVNRWNGILPWSKTS